MEYRKLIYISLTVFFILIITFSILHVIFILITIYIWSIRKEPIDKLGIKKGFPGIFSYLFGFFIGVTMIVGVLCILLVLSRIFIQYNTINIPILLYYLVYDFCISLVEELFYRSLLLNYVILSSNCKFDILLSAFFFSISHAGNLGFNLIAFLNLLIYGVLAGYFLRKWGTINVPVGIHHAWNYFEYRILGIESYGHSFPSALMNIQISGPLYITGGIFGIEASISTSIIFLVSLIITIFIGSLREEENKKLKTEYQKQGNKKKRTS